MHGGFNVDAAQEWNLAVRKRIAIRSEIHLATPSGPLARLSVPPVQAVSGFDVGTRSARFMYMLTLTITRFERVICRFHSSKILPASHRCYIFAGEGALNSLIVYNK